MSVSVPQTRISAEQYLEDEERADVRHEYLGGLVYAMAGASDEHNTIAGNMFARLKGHLRGGPCRVYISDMKARVEAADVFYYPDILVTCDPNDNERYFKTRPTIIVEVTSPSTTVTDHREKWAAYQKLDSLCEYVLIAQDQIKVEVLKRQTTGTWWEHRVHPDETLKLESIGFEIAVSEVYEGVQLNATPDEEVI